MQPQSTPPTALRYQPELMGIRAVAVGLVIIHHWMLIGFPLGEMGRLPLFVLSGYLISGILWKNQIYWGGKADWYRRLGIFYSRRFLRIIPPYYASLALGALLPLVTLHQYPVWFLLPLSNMLCYRLQHWPEGAGHYWSMAVEEQFYIIWPFLLGLFRRRTVGLWLLIVGAAAYRAYLTTCVATAATGFINVLLPSCLDLFAVGALLRLHLPTSLAQLSRAKPWAGWPAALTWLSWIGLCFSIPFSSLGAPLWIVFYPSLGAAASYFTLRWLMHRPPLARWLAHPLAQWLGQRSYGLYLYHLMLPVFYQRLVYHFTTATAHAWRPWLMQPWLMTLLLFPLLISVSALSWRWLEAPLEKLRARYPYAPATAPQPA